MKSIDQFLQEGYSKKTNVYHYSLKPYKQVKNMMAQNPNPDEKKIAEWKELDKDAKFRSDLPYYKHISLALDPLPFDIIMSNKFAKDHKIWKKGSVFYEHVISINDIPTNTPWKMVETPFDMFMADNLWFEQDMYKRVYFKFRKFSKIISGLQANSTKHLANKILKYQGSYDERFRGLANRKDFDELKNKYMPTIPHLFVYPEDGIIKVRSVKKIQL